MGLKKKSTNGVFIKIVHGRGIVMSVEEGTEDAKPRTLKDGRVVYELVFDELAGFIKDISTREIEHNGKAIKFWSVRIYDKGQNYYLSMPYSSRYATSFLTRLQNVDFSKPVEIRTAYFASDDKTVLWLTQDGQKVEKYYTKDDPKDLPQMEQKEFKGEMVWDDSKMMKFLSEMVENEINPKLQELQNAEADQPVDEIEDDDAPAPVAANDEEDDLPF